MTETFLELLPVGSLERRSYRHFQICPCILIRDYGVKILGAKLLILLLSQNSCSKVGLPKLVGSTTQCGKPFSGRKQVLLKFFDIGSSDNRRDSYAVTIPEAILERCEIYLPELLIQICFGLRGLTLIVIEERHFLLQSK